MFGLPRTAGCYLCAVIATAGGLAGYYGITGGFASLDGWALLALAALFVICDSLPARLTIDGARMSLGFTASLAAVVLLGPFGAALVGAAAVVTGQRGLSAAKRLFNGAQFALCGFAAGGAYAVAGGERPEFGGVGWIGRMVGPYAVALAAFVAANLVLTGGILLFSRRATVRELVHASGPVAAGCLGYGVFGLLIAVLWAPIGPLVEVLVLIPLLAARWAMEQAYLQRRTHAATLAALGQAVETKDPLTQGHCLRVSGNAVMIARQLGMRPERVTSVQYAGMLHDVGKLGVPTEILTKPGKLTEEEFAQVQLHPLRGLEIVREIGFLGEALAGIMHHHERMDGRGYPMGLAGDEIPEFARMLGVADAFDVMTSARPYCEARAVTDAVEELRRCSGTQFDPAMVDAFLRALASTDRP